MDRVLEVINQDWGAGSPNPAVPINNFSARFSTTLDQGAGSYRITTTADDRFRIHIDGETVMDEWDTDIRNKTYSTQLELGEETNHVTVEFRDLITYANITTTMADIKQNRRVGRV